MKRIFVLIFLFFLSVNLLAEEMRFGITSEEMVTLEKLEAWNIVENDYDKLSINQPMSRIDVMSLNIKTYSFLKKDLDKLQIDILDAQKESIKDFKNFRISTNKKIEYMKEDLYGVINQQDKTIQKQTEELALLKSQADTNIWIWLLIGVALVL